MNGRKAKKWRRIARGATVGQPNVRYETIRRAPGQYVGGDGFPVLTHRDTIQLAQGCTRRLYQTLKTTTKRAHRNGTR